MAFALNDQWEAYASPNPACCKIYMKLLTHNIDKFTGQGRFLVAIYLASVIAIVVIIPSGVTGAEVMKGCLLLT
ncbi:hypothetical protein M434DRAFT_143196 [Hypoxylon sp. CO27-5]|nr:hypothetical protein M434DRAFT_143196 [Hypoxylon sp. CO27-5]